MTLRSPLGVRLPLQLAAAALLGAWSLTLGLHVAPVERELKMSQKIFYFHMPLGVWTLVGTLVAAVAAAAYLARRREAADRFSAACQEVSVVSCAVVLVTGSLWARPAWDDWFPWGEPRVTGMLVLFLLGLAYFIVRSSVDDLGRRARFSAVVMVVAAADALLAYFAIHLWNTNHPRVIAPGEDGGVEVGLHPAMARALAACLVSTGLLFWTLVEARYRLAALEARATRLAAEAEQLAEASP